MNSNKFSNRALDLYDVANQKNQFNSPEKANSQINKLNVLLEDERRKVTHFQNKFNKLQEESNAEKKRLISKIDNLTAESVLLEDDRRKATHFQNEFKKLQEESNAEKDSLTSKIDILTAELQAFKDKEQKAISQRIETNKKSRQRKTICEHGKKRSSR